MCSRTLRTPGGNARAWVIVFAAVASAVVAAPAPAAVVPVGPSVDQFDLGSTDEPFRIDISSDPLAADPAAEAPVVVPLPPALGAGMAALGAMAALRAGRRVVLRR